MDHRQGAGVGRQLNQANQLNEQPELFGVLAINKPAGKTSRDVVNHVQRLLRARKRSDTPKIGHTGTLDPMATGVLLLAIGKATRLVEYAHLQRKSYEADFLLGQTSPTLDIEGQVESLADACPIDHLQWIDQMQNWRGRIRQTPPQYSACRINGQRAYKLARQGVEFEIVSREVMIHSLELLAFDYTRVTMQIACSSGTYIRSLGNDIAVALSSAAIMSRLVRTNVGSFQLSDCCQLDELNSLSDVKERMSSPIGLVDQLPRIVVTNDDCQRLRCGMTVAITGAARSILDAQPAVEQFRAELENSDDDEGSGQDFSRSVVALDEVGRLAAILDDRGDHFQPTRVFL